MTAEIRKCALLVEDNLVNIKLFESHFKRACPSWDLIIVRDALNAASAIKGEFFTSYKSKEQMKLDRLDVIFLDNTFFQNPSESEAVADLGIQTAKIANLHFQSHPELSRPKIIAYSTDEREEFGKPPFDAKICKVIHAAVILECFKLLGLQDKI